MDRRNISTTARNYNYYLGLHRPTIKGLIWTNKTIVDELQKTAVDFIYIVNMTKPETNRH